MQPSRLRMSSYDMLKMIILYMGSLLYRSAREMAPLSPFHDMCQFQAEDMAFRYTRYSEKEKKSNGIPVTGSGDLEGCLDNRHADGSEIVSLTRRPPLYCQQTFFSSRTHLC
jgi:hypothetical protein